VNMSLVHHTLDNRNVAMLMKIATIVLALFASSVVVITAAEHALQSAAVISHQGVPGSGAALGSAHAVPAPHTAGPDESAESAIARQRPDQESIDTSRECRPVAGIVSQCIYN
jgi:hypothetical protein